MSWEIDLGSMNPFPLLKLQLRFLLFERRSFWLILGGCIIFFFQWLCNPGGGHFHIMELRIRVNKNVEKGSDFCHRASSTFLEIRGQFSTTSTLRVSILNNEHRHLGSYFRPIRCCFRSPDFLGTDGRHLGMACRLLQYIVMIKRVTLVCKRDLRWKRLWYESE